MKNSVVPLVALAWLATHAVAAADVEHKAPRYKGGPSTPYASDFPALADIPEVEPNGSPALAQEVGCGNSLSPAALDNVAAVPDSDWIRFTASAGDLITFETRPDGPDQFTDTVINLIADDGVTSLASNDDGGTFPYSRIADFQAPYTGTYYGRIRGFLGAEGPYRANVSCAPPPPPPGNDRCAGAIDIPCGPIDLSGTTRFAAGDYDLCPGQPVCPASCTGFSSPGRDVAYRLIVGVGAVLDVTYEVDPAAVDASIYVVSDCANVQASCVAGRDSDVGTPAERLTYGFSTPGVYYLILDAFTEGGGAWTLRGALDCATAARSDLTWGKLKVIYR